MDDPFPASIFDEWAESYDRSVTDQQNFPFAGYEEVLATVVRLAQARPGDSVLDLGAGTGNLALRFAALGCEIWGTDFSAAMLAKARPRLPGARLIQLDLRGPWPAELQRRFECIVSAYVFHHFDLAEKVRLITKLAREHLEPGGRLVIADIAFPDQKSLEAVQRAVADEWEDEFYWLADEVIPALEAAGLKATFYPVSAYAGVFAIEKTDPL